VENSGPPSIRNSTFDAPRVRQWSWTCVGALQSTGDGGPVNVRICTVEATVEVGAAAVLAVGATGTVEVGAAVAVAGLVVEVDDGGLVGVDCLALLEHAASTTKAAGTVSEASRVLGIGRS
jgi:hypothetical protein